MMKTNRKYEGNQMKIISVVDSYVRSDVKNDRIETKKR